jgi:hypothetical protein
LVHSLLSGWLKVPRAATAGPDALLGKTLQHFGLLYTRKAAFEKCFQMRPGHPGKKEKSEAKSVSCKRCKSER